MSHTPPTSTVNQPVDLPGKSLWPASPTPLLGREAEVAAIRQRLQQPEVRLLTLTGPPGVGKTRLSLETIEGLSFAGGSYFVPLASLRDPDLVLFTIAQSLGLREEGDRQPLDQLLAYLAGRQILLLLDNFEQVIAAAPVVAELLAAAPGLKLLVTSRARLHLRGEYEFPVMPLAVPDLKKISGSGEALLAYPAVALFQQRAQALKPDFRLTPENSLAVAEICVRLDGLPLSIELAAARIKLLPPAAMLARLERRLQLLTGGPQDLPARQQTLRDTLAWSYDLLEAGTQRLFRRLAVFSGGCALEGAEIVSNIAGEPPMEVLNRVDSLIDKSLLLCPPGKDEAEPRLMMLESIREYALEQLQASGEADAVRRAHAGYILALAETAEPHLTGVEQRLWLDRLELEHDNIRAALGWSLAESPEIALQLGGALWQFWFARGYMSEGRRWLQEALAAGEAAPAPIRAKASGGAAILAAYLGAYPQAARFAEQALTLCRQLDFKPGITAALNGLVFISGMQGDHERARSLAEEGIALSRTLDAPRSLADALYYAALTAWLRGDYPAAQAFIEEAITLFQNLGDERGVASSLYGLGLVLVAQGQYGRAEPLFKESLGALRALNDKRSVTMCLAGLADIALSRNETVAARALAGEALDILKEVGDRWFAAFSLDGLAMAVAAEGQAGLAARFFAAASAMRQAIGAALPAARRPAHDQYLPSVQRQLGPSDFSQAWQEGQSLTLERIISLLKQVSTPSSQKTPPPAGLTSREVQVLHLVAQGLTDSQVAEQLVISPRTVHSHLNSIYNKLGINSRTAAVRYAVEQGIG